MYGNLFFVCEDAIRAVGNDDGWGVPLGVVIEAAAVTTILKYSHKLGVFTSAENRCSSD